MVAPSTNVIKGGILLDSITHLGSRLGGISIGTNLNESLALLINKRFEKSRPKWCFPI
jgi:hypothetical protein